MLNSKVLVRNESLNRIEVDWKLIDEVETVFQVFSKNWGNIATDAYIKNSQFYQVLQSILGILIEIKT